MQRFWSAAAVQLGKRAGLVSLVGILVTAVLGIGVTRLHFSTGQDAYLNKSDRVYQDNVKYQSLFGGEAMLGVIAMQPGHTVDELFDSSGRNQLTALHDELSGTRRYVAVITPLLALQYDDVLVQGHTPGGDPTKSVAGQALLTALNSEQKGSPQAAARQKDAVAT